MTGPDANTQDTRPAVTTHRLLGIAGVLLGALIATNTGRLMSMGLADIRGALHLAAEVLGLQVRQQAHTLAISDSSLLLAACCVVCLVVVSFMSKVPTQYRRITAAPVEAK
jgi:hypothetical protein